MNKIPGGLSQGMSLEDLAKKHKVGLELLQTQLNKGIEVEKEHTTDESIAQEIAMDHLFEDPFYYDKLATIEELRIYEPGENILNPIKQEDLLKAIKQEDLLKESKQVGILYHYTSIGRLSLIIKNDELSPLIVNTWKSPLKKTTYSSDNISFTRNKNFHKTSRNISGIGTRIVLDGDKLSENYKITPTAEDSYQKNTGNFEAEERINDVIKPLDKYVISYDIFLPEAETEFLKKNGEDTFMLNVFIDILKELKDIPKINFYKKNQLIKWDEVFEMYDLNQKQQIAEEDKKGIKAYSLEIAQQIGNQINELFNENDEKDFLKNITKKLIKEVTKYALNKGYNIIPLPKVNICYTNIKNAIKPLARTGHYNPDLRYIQLYALYRHPKDVLRTFCHELIHHIQNNENRLHQISTDNINEDEALKELEREAYEKGNILLREWENSFKKNINENQIKETPYEDTHPEIKYWALYANLYDVLKKKPELYDQLKLKLSGEKIKALDYFHNFLSGTLNEAKQIGTLYHFTRLDYFSEILDTDRLESRSQRMLMDTEPSSKEKKTLEKQRLPTDKRKYYISIYGFSTTRNKHLYKKEKIDGGGLVLTWLDVRIVLDGNKLSENYKIIPYNAFAFEDRKFDKNRDHSKWGHTEYPHYEENEEVVITKTKHLTDLDKYVISYDILLDQIEKHFSRKLNYLRLKFSIQDYYSLINNIKLSFDNSKIRYFYKEKQVDINEYLATLKKEETQAINEAKQLGNIYHFTSPVGIIGILSSGNIKGNRIFKENHTTYVASLTRDKNLHKKSIQIGGTSVRITLDGDKLSEHYKIEPFRDQGYSMKGHEYMDFGIRDTFEAEERIIFNKPEIPIVGYIKSVDIVDEIRFDLDKIKNLCKKHNISFNDLTEITEIKYFSSEEQQKYPDIKTCIAVCFKDDKILVGKSTSKDDRKDLWVFPGGGWEPNGETLKEGAVRELWEEAGIISIYTEDEPILTPPLSWTKCQYVSGKLKPNHEFSKLLWINPKDLGTKYPTLPNNIEILKQLEGKMLTELKILTKSRLREIGEIQNNKVQIAEYKNQETLNPIIWKDNNMKPELKEVLQKIGEQFYKGLEVDIPLEDILLIGSSANYNWTQYSDIDLHLVMDFQSQTNADIFKKYFDSKKVLFNDKYNLQYKGHNIEVYVQDTHEPNAATGIYSILKGKWIQEPSKEKIDIPDELIQKKVQPLMSQIDDIINGGGSMENIKKLKEKIRNFRKNGLEQGGEYSLENLAFKTLRYNGYLEKLNDYQKEKQIEDFGIEDIQEAKQRGNLYHYTSLYYFSKILQTKQLNTRKLDDHEITDKVMFDSYKDFKFLSLTRDKEFVKQTRLVGTSININDGYVRITLDGDKLSENYKIIPYSYWTSGYPEATKIYKLSAIKLDNLWKNESEERLLTKKSYIPIEDYVLKYEVYLTKKNLDYWSKYVRLILDEQNPKVQLYIDNKLVDSNKLIDKLTTSSLKQVAESKLVYDAWVVPDLETLKREYHIEHELKGHNYFDSLEEFLYAIKNATIETISSEDIDYTTKTDSYDDLLDLIKSYKSYPTYRNEKTLKDLYFKFKNNQPLDYPIIIEFSKSNRRIFSGNTRLNVAEQLNIPCKALIIKSILKETLDEAKQRGNLYHFTGYYHLPKILKTNSLIGKEDLLLNSYSISLTRDSSFSSYFLGVPKDVRIILDGDKLSENYKIIPYNDRSLVAKNKSPWNEQEERVYTKEITDLDKYVISYDIFLDKWKDKSKIISLLENPKIRIFYKKNDKLEILPKNLIKTALVAEDLDKNDLKTVEKVADLYFDPKDIKFSNHFFDRVNDVRNKVEISFDELVDFFKRLSKHKVKFIEFLKKYREIVVTDDKTKINIPFIDLANKALAKTIMRKHNFDTSNPKLIFEAKQRGNLYHFTGISSALQIIADNKLGKDDKTISTTRDQKFVTQSPRPIGGNEIGFILDGDKLSEIYKIGPYDYNHDNPGEDVGDEQEELIWGKKLEKQGGIKNLKSYIKGIILTKHFFDKIIKRYGDFIIPSQFKNYLENYSIGYNETWDDEKKYQFYQLRDGNFRTTYELKSEDKIELIKNIIEGELHIKIIEQK